MGQEFARNIRDGVRAIRVSPDVLDGLPADFVASHPAGDDGLVEVTTAYPDYVPFVTFCRDREARAALVHEFLNRAYPENDAVLHDLLALRREHAGLLGYDGWPSYDAEVKMIGTGAAIPAFVDRITETSDGAARRDVDVLLSGCAGTTPARPRSTPSTRRSTPRCCAGRTSTSTPRGPRLLRLRQGAPRAARGHRPALRRGVRRGRRRRLARGRDVVRRGSAGATGSAGSTSTCTRGPGKYGHAAQFSLTPGIAGRQLAEGVLVCNFSKALMEHDHVVTLFHEFGHLVHHVLAGGHAWTRFSGVATEWDFVEAPSQMLEEWAWDADVLRSFATDADDRPIPRELVEKMRAAHEFGKGMYARTQMFYAALSYRLHQDVPDDITATCASCRPLRRFTPVPDTHFHASFGHLEGYARATTPTCGAWSSPRTCSPPSTRTTCSPPRWRTATATGSWPPAAAGTPPTWSRTSSAGPTTSGLRALARRLTQPLPPGRRRRAPAAVPR